jgi:hypothetical protein
MEEDVPDMLWDFLLDLTRTGTPAKKKLAASLLRVAQLMAAALGQCSGPVSHIQMYGLETASYYRQRPNILVRWTCTDWVGLISKIMVLLKKPRYGRATKSCPDNVQTILVRRTSTDFLCT